MSYIIGDDGINTLEGTSASDVIKGLGGNDKLYSALDGNSPYAEDFLYGGSGDDLLGFDLNERTVRGLRSGDLVKPLADGGSGDDSVVFYYAGVGNFNVSSLVPLVNDRGIENWGFDFVTSKGEIVGTSRSDWLGATTNGPTTIDGGGGSDRVDAHVLDGSLTIRGGAGRDILSGYYTVGSGRAKAIGGEGADLFVFSNMPRYDTPNGRFAQGMIVEDFTRGRDKILIDLLTDKYGDKNYYFLDSGPFHGKADATAYHDYIDYDEKTGVLRIDGREHGVIEGSPHLNSSDFLFI